MLLDSLSVSPGAEGEFLFPQQEWPGRKAALSMHTQVPVMLGHEPGLWTGVQIPMLPLGSWPLPLKSHFPVRNSKGVQVTTWLTQSKRRGQQRSHLFIWRMEGWQGAYKLEFCMWAVWVKSLQRSHAHYGLSELCGVDRQLHTVPCG